MESVELDSCLVSRALPLSCFFITIIIINIIIYLLNLFQMTLSILDWWLCCGAVVDVDRYILDIASTPKRSYPQDFYCRHKIKPALMPGLLLFSSSPLPPSPTPPSCVQSENQRAVPTWWVRAGRVYCDTLGT
jgi:hypothetical protein